MSYDDVISFDSLYKGLKKSCSNVRWKDSVVGYEYNRLKNTYKLKQDLLGGKYKIDRYQHFVIHEPKRREIIATRLFFLTFPTTAPAKRTVRTRAKATVL